MGLNIKNERVRELAQRAAQLTGKSQAAAIEEALEFLIAKRGAHPEIARQERLDALWSEIQASTTEAARAATRRTMDELHDEAGLPR